MGVSSHYTTIRRAQFIDILRAKLSLKTVSKQKQSNSTSITFEYMNTYGFYSINRQKKPATVPDHEWPSIISGPGTRF